jgi:hypothetical protein
MSDFLDDFLLSDTDIAGISQIPDTFGPTLMKDVQQRYDVYHEFRDEYDMHLVELRMSWSPPAPLLYDWYRTSSGWTVSLEAPASLSRPWSVPIAIRVRHEDDNKEPTFHKLGRTLTFDERDPELLERVRREIGEAFAEGESPLWRLRRHVDLPSFVVDALEQQIDHKHAVGNLELKGTKALLLTLVLKPWNLLDAMHAHASTYTRRRV